jgi:hypothetical protein
MQYIICQLELGEIYFLVNLRCKYFGGAILIKEGSVDYAVVKVKIEFYNY